MILCRFSFYPFRSLRRTKICHCCLLNIADLFRLLNNNRDASHSTRRSTKRSHSIQPVYCIKWPLSLLLFSAISFRQFFNKKRNCTGQCYPFSFCLSTWHFPFRTCFHIAYHNEQTEISSATMLKQLPDRKLWGIPQRIHTFLKRSNAW